MTTMTTTATHTLRSDFRATFAASRKLNRRFTRKDTHAMSGVYEDASVFINSLPKNAPAYIVAIRDRSDAPLSYREAALVANSIVDMEARK